jgi:hypothetical protein
MRSRVEEKFRCRVLHLNETLALNMINALDSFGLHLLCVFYTIFCCLINNFSNLNLPAPPLPNRNSFSCGFRAILRHFCTFLTVQCTFERPKSMAKHFITWNCEKSCVYFDNSYFCCFFSTRTTRKKSSIRYHAITLAILETNAALLRDLMT